MAWSVGERSNVKRGMSNKAVPLRSSDDERDTGPAEGKSVTGTAKGSRDLGGGMEILELEFLLGVVEDTKGADRNDITMRKLSFNEMIRREELNEIDSVSLKVYARDDEKLYGKDIQCAAMKELTIRTSRKNK